MAVEHEVLVKTRMQEMRGNAVILGPSLVLDGLVAASILAASAAAWERARLRERPVWRLVAVGALVPWVYRLFLRPKVMNWGVTRQEILQTLPGDEVVAQSAENLNHAITLRARPEDIWPWLVQLGSGERGGFYSYDWLERLAGFPVWSAERILPEYQNLKEGDLVTPPDEEMGWRVLRMEPGRALVIGTRDFSWAFVLQPLDGEHTRLLVRARAGQQQGPFARIGNLIILPHFFMQLKMLKGLRRRAERTARQREAGAVEAWKAPTEARPSPEQSPTPRV